jgi:hypothetical protein
MGIFPNMTQLQEKAAKAQQERDEVKRAQIISIASAIISGWNGPYTVDCVVDLAFEVYNEIDKRI